MGKRSRGVSSSPSGDELASDFTEVSAEPENTRTTKIVAYDSPAVFDEQHAMHCSLPPHSESLAFNTLNDFEIHYVKEHTNRCIECGRNLPSEHFLALHIDENHNPVREALAAKGEKTYACFVVDCDKSCSTPQKRRLHMIDKHNFPKMYNFRVVNQGIDNAKTLLQEGRKRRVSVTNDQSMSHRSRASSISESVQVYPGTTMKDLSLGPKSVAPPKASHANLKPRLLNTSMTDLPSKPDVIDDLGRSFAALHFVPRSVLSNNAKAETLTE